MFRLVALTIIYCFLTLTTGAQGENFARSADPNTVATVRARPDLAVELQDVTQLKLVARKVTYHAGEMIQLDLGILNLFHQPLFLEKWPELKVRIQNEVGKSIYLQRYAVSDRTLTSNSFELLAPDDFATFTFDLLIGCDERAFQPAAAGETERMSFDQGHFLSWGDACIHESQPGRLSITVETHNDQVVVAPRTNTKTATGHVVSNTLEVTIVP